MLCSVYEYGRVLHMRPLPHHLWRQTTCLSITQEYAEGGNSFFEPAVQSFIADDATSGKTAAEFPIIYYVIGSLWKLIGRTEFAYRLIMLLLHAAGSWALFALTLRVLKDGALAVMVALFFFTVPTVVYFTLAFLPDVPALDFVLLGALALTRFMEAGGFRNGTATLFCFAMGGLLKITALMVPMALFLALSAVLLVPAWRAKALFDLRRIPIVWGGLILVFLIVAAWTWYAVRYNHWNSASYSVMGTWALWDIGEADRASALRFGRDILIYQIFDGPVWWALAGMLLVLIRYVRWIPVELVLFNAFLFGGTVLYVLLWTIALNNHDYYFIAPLVLPISLMLTFFWMVRERWPQAITSRWTKATLFLLLVYHGAYAATNHQMRTQAGRPVDAAALLPLYHDAELEHWRMTQYWAMADLLDIVPLARKVGVLPQDLVITVPDESVCSALYLIEQHGFNEFGGVRMDSATVADRVRRGAKYLYLLGNDTAVTTPLEGWLDRRILAHGEVGIYDLRRSP